MAVTRFERDSAPRRVASRWPVRGVLLLAGAKLADALTTTVALTFLPLVELNPVVRTLIGEVGILPGVILGSGLAVAFITGVTELGVYLGDRVDPEPRDVAWIRYVGYGLPTVLFGIAALYNLGLMLLVL